MDDAKVEFSTLVQQYPEDDELRYSLALVPGSQGLGRGQGLPEDLIAWKAMSIRHTQPRPHRRRTQRPAGALIEYAQVGPAMTICRPNCVRPTS
jgi:hypothetical protein